MPSSSNQFGVVYSLTSTLQYERELHYSIKRLKKFYPEWPITVFYSGDITHKFDNVVLQKVQKENPFVAKARAILSSPYQKTLFLDTDVVLISNIDSAIVKSKGYDITLCESPKANWKQKELISLTGTNYLSTGMILYKRSKPIEVFFNEWLLRLIEIGKHKKLTASYGDEIAFNKIIKEKRKSQNLDISIGLLDNRYYNVTNLVYRSLTKNEKNSVSVIHCHKLYKSIVRLSYFKPNIGKALLSIKNMLRD